MKRQKRLQKPQDLGPASALRFWRKKLRMTQQKLASVLGYADGNYIGQIENGARDINKKFFVAVAHYAGQEGLSLPPGWDKLADSFSDERDPPVKFMIECPRSEKVATRDYDEALGLIRDSFNRYRRFPRVTLDGVLMEDRDIRDMLDRGDHKATD